MLGDPMLSSMGAGALRPKVEKKGNAREKEDTKKEWKYKEFFKRAFAASASGSKFLMEDELEVPVVTLVDSQLLRSLQLTGEQLDASQSKRRGAFINHTPRSHESYHGVEPPYSQQAARHDQSGGLSEGHTNTYNGHNDLMLSEAQGGNLELGVMESAPVELDSKEVTLGAPESDSLMNCHTPKEEAVTTPSVTESATHANPPEHRCIRVTNSFEIKTGGRSQLMNKSVYLQPRHLSASARAHSTSAGISRHSPLEPLVARHRREITGSDVDVLPPHVDINDINGTVTFMEVQEYYCNCDRDENQNSQFLSEAVSKCIHRESDVDQDSEHNERGGAVGSPLLHDTLLPSDTCSLEAFHSSAPSPPARNPVRLDAPPNICQMKSLGPDEDLDFASAAEGHYSPYHCEAYGPVTPPHMRRALEHESDGSEETYSLDISTPRHELLRNDSQLRDLNYFLRNTGPPTLLAKPSKRKVFSFGALGKIRADTHRRDANPFKTNVSPVSALPPMLSVHAREEKTRNGTRYAKILVPEDCDWEHQMDSSYMEDVDPRSNHLSDNLLLTEEMFNPLGSPPVENAIAGYASNSPSTPSLSGSQETTIHSPRSPKPVPHLPTRIPVDSHPLAATRQDKTRERKLRDLHKSRTTTRSADDYEYKGEQTKLKVLVDSKEWVRIQRLNKELARQLAMAAGLEGEGEGLTPEYVLEVSQMTKRPVY